MVSSLIEFAYYYIISDDMDQGIIPWEEFWDLSFWSVIRFLIIIFVVYKASKEYNGTFLYLTSFFCLIEFLLFIPGGYFIFYTPLFTNLLIVIICIVVLLKSKIKKTE
jgi:hypothetical protein